MSPSTRTCIFPGCKNFHSSAASLFQFPSDEERKNRWIDFVKSHTDGELRINSNSRLCSDHFTPDSFNMDRRTGFTDTRLLLQRGAVPSIALPAVPPPVAPGPSTAASSSSLSHEHQIMRTFDEVMKLGRYDAGLLASSSGGADREAGPAKVREETDEAAEETNASLRDPFFAAGHRGGSLEEELDGLPVFGVDDEEDDWQFSLPMDTLADLDTDRIGARLTDESSDRQRDVQGGPLTSEKTPEGRATLGDRRVSAFSSPTPSPDSLDGAVVNYPGGDPPCHQVESLQRSDCGAIAIEAPTSPLIKIKDEPIDEDYDAALLPQSSSRQVKEELENQEDELKISSVYSVGGGPSYSAPSVAGPTTHTPSIFVPGRSLAPAPLVQPPLAPPLAPPLPGRGGNSANIRCCGCSKVLLKGQTAFQKKGSTQLFCSTVCLTGFLPPTVLARPCHQCLKEIETTGNVVRVLVDNNLKDFCSRFCMSAFNRKKKTDPPAPELPFCSVCNKSNKVQHEVIYHSEVHKLCSDYCFFTWRRNRNLAMNCCESCGMYCSSKGSGCQNLIIGDVNLRFCSPTCISTYKQTCSKLMKCSHCGNEAMVSTMLVSNDPLGKVKLYCSSTCVSYSRPPQHILSGTPFPCTHCKVNAVPQYHLAMVDGSIRNFCSHDCVTTFRSRAPLTAQMNGTSTNPLAPPQPDLPGTGSSPCGLSPLSSSWPAAPGHPDAPSQTSAAPCASTPGSSRPYEQPQQGLTPLSASRFTGPIRLTCNYCFEEFSSKPELFLHKNRVYQFCGKQCCDRFKTQRNIIMRCEYCLQDKVVKDIIMFNHMARPFCSESCKLLFKHDLTKKNKDSPWRSCAFCSGICQNMVNQKMIHSHFGGRMEEFCKPECMSMFTVLFYEMAKCDNCRHQGKMEEQLRCAGYIRHFCDLACTLQYCHRHIPQIPARVASQGSSATVQNLFPSSKMALGIADVVPAGNTPTGLPHSADTPLTGALPTSNSHGKSLDDASTQTDAMRLPLAHRRNMKNKAIMCRPFTHSQETLCNLPTQTTHTPAGISGCSFTTTINEEKVKVVILPVPVPVFIPVPMNMYSQYTPVPMPMPIPVPLPVVLPSAPSGSQSKDTHDPLVQSQGIAEEVEEVEKGKPVSHGDQGSTYSGDLESEAISTPLSWAEESNPASSSQRGGGPVAVDPPSTSEPGAMDLEADIPTERCDSSERAVVRKLAGCKRPREGFSPGKRSRKRACSGEVSLTVSSSRTTKLHYVYGVQAWKTWVQQRKQQPDSESSKSDGPVVLKEDFLQCNSAELSDGLCHFITEVRRPNGGPYTPDSIFYLCLGIQLYLFENGRIENIFTDELYSRFTVEITRILERWRPTLSPSGYLCSRVEEDYLWECKQLGTYSPIVLLNTLLFFSTKTFRFTDAGQHRRLSFANFTHCTRSPGKTDYLRFRPPHRDQGTSELLPVSPGKRKMEEEEGDMEMPENRENPLHCPVQLYEFYLSKCSESVKNRDDLFYLQPLVSCHPDSPRWFSSQPLDGATLDSMLTRILAVRQVHLDEGSEASTDDGGSP
ncbi:zinc finger MYM-type protein 4 isoform X1 [Hypomesus transpacificus]|uniref:zinc finger MYM-type protein 4 isoform X1 n=1 Tax=Hypomesus transpacificus TaxID=137520 RepID=UPI001F078CDB|nr:zinc finger MYM-type protein 4 isoform X1 [Hypomesus transpacificus]